jgi:hypothetical protein
MGLSFDPRAALRGVDVPRHRPHRAPPQAASCASKWTVRMPHGTSCASHGVRRQQMSRLVWNAVALHTTPGIPQFMRPEIALLQAGRRHGRGGPRLRPVFSEAQRAAVVAASPAGSRLRAGHHRRLLPGHASTGPLSTFGTFNDDVLAFKDPALPAHRHLQPSSWLRTGPAERAARRQAAARATTIHTPRQTAKPPVAPPARCFPAATPARGRGHCGCARPRGTWTARLDRAARAPVTRPHLPDCAPATTA